MVIEAHGRPGVSGDDLLLAVESALSDLPTMDAELLLAGARLARTRLARRLTDPAELARALAEHQAIWGDWRVLYGRLGGLATLTEERLRSVAATFFDLSAAEGSAPSPTNDRRQGE